MPSSIPYDPSLILGNIVDESVLSTVEKISALQGPVDAAQDTLNSLLSSRRSLDMTKAELANLSISTEPLDKALGDLNNDISSSAATYAETKAKAEMSIRGLRSGLRGVHVKVESPLDYVKSVIKSMPLAAESINMDVQYFSKDTNQQDADSYANNISEFVTGTGKKLLGPKITAEVATAAKAQASSQWEKHDIHGTLVIAVSCTHKQSSVLAPCILNVDKGIGAWNFLFKDDKLDPTDLSAMTRVFQEGYKGDGNKFSIISGMTFGSSFVGMVHILNSTNTEAREKVQSFASSVQASVEMEGFLVNASGGFGVSEAFSNDLKSLLSTQSVTSHVTMICKGAIPSIVANDVKSAVKEFKDFDPQNSMKAIEELSNATAGEQQTVKASAAASRTGGQLLSMKANEMKTALSALAVIDTEANKVLNTNSMMKALEDYLAKATTGDCGVPINYYLKDITKFMLAEMWVSKYFPGQFMQVKFDDSEDNAGGANAPTAAS